MSLFGNLFNMIVKNLHMWEHTSITLFATQLKLWGRLTAFNLKKNLLLVGHTLTSEMLAKISLPFQQFFKTEEKNKTCAKS